MKAFDPRLIFAAALLVIAVGSSTTSQAASITLIADRDNTLIESAIGEKSNGIGPAFFSGRTGQGSDSVRRGVLGFDVAAAIPAGSIIESATLTLTYIQGNSSTTLLSLHALLADWGEGTSTFNGAQGSPSTPGDATWIHGFFNTDLWAAPGGDFDAAASASIFSSSGNEYTWSSSGMRSDVQDWLDNPGDEFGWILLGDESVGGSAIKWASRDNGTASVRPALTIVYSPEPNTMLLMATGIFTLAISSRGRSSKGRSGGSVGRR